MATSTVTLVSGREIEVEYEYIPGDFGRRNAYGQQMEPDCPEGIEIESMIDEYGEDAELTDKEERELKAKILDEIHEEAYDRQYADRD